jgi:hypothetical protein
VIFADSNRKLSLYEMSGIFIRNMKMTKIIEDTIRISQIFYDFKIADRAVTKGSSITAFYPKSIAPKGLFKNLT